MPAIFLGALISGATRRDVAARAARDAPPGWDARVNRVTRAVRAVIHVAETDPGYASRWGDPAILENDYFRLRNRPRG